MTAMRHHDKGFTLIELLIVVAIIGIIAAIAIPGMLRARMSGNEASAIGSLRAVTNGQFNFATNCGHHTYAATLAELAVKPPSGIDGFISEDLATDPALKSGYVIALSGGPGAAGVPAACNGATQVVSYAVTATPSAPGTTGDRYFFANGLTIYQDYAPIAPVQTGPPATGRPLQ